MHLRDELNPSLSLFAATDWGELICRMMYRRKIAAVYISAAGKGAINRRGMVYRFLASLKLQTWTIQLVIRKSHVAMNTAACALEFRLRASLQRKLLVSVIGSAVVLSAFFRRRFHRDALLARRSAVRRLQAALRRQFASSSIKFRKSAIQLLQAACRRNGGYGGGDGVGVQEVFGKHIAALVLQVFQLRANAPDDKVRTCKSGDSDVLAFLINVRRLRFDGR